MTEIERAISEIVGSNYGECQCHRETMELAVAALTEQAARINPKPLTLDELRERIGKPVWDESGDCAVIESFYYDSSIGEFIVFTDDTSVMTEHIGNKVRLNDSPPKEDKP